MHNMQGILEMHVICYAVIRDYLCPIGCVLHCDFVARNLKDFIGSFSGSCLKWLWPAGHTVNVGNIMQYSYCEMENVYTLT